jgi:hypothetical protein
MPEETITSSRTDTLRLPICSAAIKGNAIPAVLRAIRPTVEEFIPIDDALLVSPATPKPVPLVVVYLLIFLYLPYAPRNNRVTHVSIKLVRRLSRISLGEAWETSSFADAKNGSVCLEDKKGKSMNGEGRRAPAKNFRTRELYGYQRAEAIFCHLDNLR